MQNTYSEERTPIGGLRLLLNKVVGDERGVFGDLAETDNPIFEHAVKHLHVSIATHKGVGRGGHYHYRLQETFWLLAGTGLCLFHDFRDASETRGTTYALVAGFEKPHNTTPLPTYTIRDGSLAQIVVPPGIYHAFFPLSKEKLVIAAAGTEGYDPGDYARPGLHEIPQAEDILQKHNITA